jgi:CrcB protein
MVAVTGFLGGYTTFSTWMVHSDELARNLAGPRWAAANLVASLLLGFGAVALGVAVG